MLCPCLFSASSICLLPLLLLPPSYPCPRGPVACVVVIRDNYVIVSVILHLPLPFPPTRGGGVTQGRGRLSSGGPADDAGPCRTISVHNIPRAGSRRACVVRSVDTGGVSPGLVRSRHHRRCLGSKGRDASCWASLLPSGSLRLPISRSPPMPR